MSSMIIEVCAVEEIAVHPNADRIERVRVKNWWCIAGKDQYKIGDKVVYVPPDAILSSELANRWGIAKYCVPLAKDISGNRPDGFRVRASRFRGVASFGTIQNLDDPTWPIGHNVREYYGITKYEPPVKAHDGDAAPEIPAFHTYTSIENIGNFPNIFKEGEEVFVSEKIHGTNSRVGLIYAPNAEGQPEWQFVAGSHGTRRKEYNDKGVRSKYWFPFKETGSSEPCPVRALLEEMKSCFNAQTSVMLFGEIFGAGIQDMQYGQKGIAYRVFDIAVDGNYIDAVSFIKVMRDYTGKILTVPYLHVGPFSMKKMEELVDGPTTVAKVEDIKEPFKGREGVVIRPAKERFDPILGGRCVLKFISVDYHERKNSNATEDH